MIGGQMSFLSGLASAVSGQSALRAVTSRSITMDLQAAMSAQSVRLKNSFRSHMLGFTQVYRTSLRGLQTVEVRAYRSSQALLNRWVTGQRRAVAQAQGSYAQFFRSVQAGYRGSVAGTTGLLAPLFRLVAQLRRGPGAGAPGGVGGPRGSGGGSLGLMGRALGGGAAFEAGRNIYERLKDQAMTLKDASFKLTQSLLSSGMTGKQIDSMMSGLSKQLVKETHGASNPTMVYGQALRVVQQTGMSNPAQLQDAVSTLVKAKQVLGDSLDENSFLGLMHSFFEEGVLKPGQGNYLFKQMLNLRGRFQKAGFGLNDSDLQAVLPAVQTEMTGFKSVVPNMSAKAQQGLFENLTAIQAFSEKAGLKDLNVAGIFQKAATSVEGMQAILPALQGVNQADIRRAVASGGPELFNMMMQWVGSAAQQAKGITGPGAEQQFAARFQGLGESERQALTKFAQLAASNPNLVKGVYGAAQGSIGTAGSVTETEIDRLLKDTGPVAQLGEGLGGLAKLANELQTAISPALLKAISGWTSTLLVGLGLLGTTGIGRTVLGGLGRLLTIGGGAAGAAGAGGAGVTLAGSTWLGGVVGGAARRAPMLSAAMGVYDVATAGEGHRAKAASGAVGATLFTYLFGAAGSALGPVGTVAGAAVGGLVGKWLGEQVYDPIANFFTDKSKRGELKSDSDGFFSSLWDGIKSWWATLKSWWGNLVGSGSTAGQVAEQTVGQAVSGALQPAAQKGWFGRQVDRVKGWWSGLFGGGGSSPVAAAANESLASAMEAAGSDPSLKGYCAVYYRQTLAAIAPDLAKRVRTQYARDYVNTLPRAGFTEVSLANMQVGDTLVYDSRRGGGAGHIAVFAGNGMMRDELGLHRMFGTAGLRAFRAPAGMKFTGQIQKAVGTALGAVGGSGAGVRIPDQYQALFSQAASQYGVPLALLAAVAKQESGFNPRARSHAGAQGMMQFMPGTARGFGINPLDPSQAVPAGAKYLRNLYNQFGSWELAVAAYNAGPGNVRKAGGIPHIAETQRYVRNVMGMAGAGLVGGGPDPLAGLFGGPGGANAVKTYEGTTRELFGSLLTDPDYLQKMGIKPDEVPIRRLVTPTPSKPPELVKRPLEIKDSEGNALLADMVMLLRAQVEGTSLDPQTLAKMQRDVEAQRAAAAARGGR